MSTHHIEIKQPSESGIGTKVMIDGKELHNIKSVSYSVSAGEIPITEISIMGLNDIDIHDCGIILDIDPTNLQESVVILQNELKQHSDLYESFRASIHSAIKDSHKEIWSGDLAEHILKRIIGEE